MMTEIQKQVKVIFPLFEYKIDMFGKSCFTAFIAI